MDKSDFVANILLAGASVEFTPEKKGEYSQEEPQVDIKEQTQDHILKLRQKALFCKSSKKQKALLYSAKNYQVA